MGSRRLPGKILMPIAGAPLLQRLIERVRNSALSDQVIVATSSEPDNDRVETLCNKLGISVIRGSETDVLSRFVTAADVGGADIIARLTADNPFVDGALVDFVVEGFLKSAGELDYINNVENSGFPYGLFVEVFSVNALRRVAASPTPEDREHVTHSIRTTGKFATDVIHAPEEFVQWRLTIDTQEEYSFASRLFQTLYDESPNFQHTRLLQKYNVDKPVTDGDI
jgi:spore coat polysaccharide biosynthesis protein SpsF